MVPMNISAIAIKIIFFIWAIVFMIYFYWATEKNIFKLSQAWPKGMLIQGVPKVTAYKNENFKGFLRFYTPLLLGHSVSE